MPLVPIDPAASAPVALAGRVVCMDAGFTVIAHGVIYAKDGSIVAVLAASAPPPAGFEAVPVIATGGTIYPGLIELHNHMPYDVLSLWQVPRPYTNRGQWSSTSTPEYHQLISGPMGVLGRDADVVPAVVRFVEVRALLGGTTTGQGVALASDSGIVKHFRGLVRNVELTGDPELPPATTHIPDVVASQWTKFKAEISGTKKLLLHLAEGIDTTARNHFLALKNSAGEWAITDNLIGIHCAGLKAADFAIFAAHGGSMVWSPLSNLLLYGGTADVGAAMAAGVPVALGSDWSPSGSKNLLGELKVARLAAELAGAPDLTARDLVLMATATPAKMLGWGAALGSLEAGKRADLLVVAGTRGEPYKHLVDASEADIDLVMINGVPRSGTTTLMTALGLTGEHVTVGGDVRVLNLAQADADPEVAAVSVADAIATLTTALQDLPLAHTRLARPLTAKRGRALLAVEGVVDNHMSSRPHLPYRGKLTGPDLPDDWARSAVAPAKSAKGATAESANGATATVGAGLLPMVALTLDPLTAVDAPGFFHELGTELNLLSAGIAAKLAEL
jgi:5-methylthioadenosine/S-adenosylhomocysteine deaminase